ncbi:hypothetical protein PR202_ga18524 [Eleusine coracana subsp. coracana]|uniref:Transcription repressor n=1 Tax=Eleusine coracana subsp. coracana TaxID=191504 RepID=A0AAV5CSV0_ELECO|nr:hypothetical protein QOZ80_4AG0298820 [Eleusine coracana subsp. coracana]GJN01271.1 hypothetical protein PR202_ga18524 [Eleusine coracana subsp. coracana]
MVKKLGLTSLFFNSSEASLSSTSFSTAASWQWPSCTQTRTRSFRCDSPEIVSMRDDEIRSKEEEPDDCFKTSMNPAYLIDPEAEEQHSYSLSSESDSSSSESLCTAVEEDDEDEVIVRSLRSNGRLFFEPESTSSIVKMKMKMKMKAAFDGATALAIDSANPYGDFRRSMEEMVMSHGINDWGWLEEMLGWYLSANGKNTHGLIVGAFVDLLVALTSAPAPPVPTSSSNAKGLLLLHPAVNKNKKGKRQIVNLTH